jgi:hypothetical protein
MLCSFSFQYLTFITFHPMNMKACWTSLVRVTAGNWKQCCYHYVCMCVLNMKLFHLRIIKFYAEIIIEEVGQRLLLLVTNSFRPVWNVCTTIVMSTSQLKSLCVVLDYNLINNNNYYYYSSVV